MFDYIEREAIIEKSHGGVIYIDDIKEIPSADVEPVLHARWEPTYAPYRTITGDIAYDQEGVRCSVCGYEPWWWDYETWALDPMKYCNCGAKMDL